MIWTLLIACGDEDILARLDALEAENAALTDRIDVLEEDLAATDAELVAVNEELAAWTGAVDLTQLQAQADGNSQAIVNLDERLAVVEDDYLVQASLDGLATETWVIDQAYAVQGDVSDLDDRVTLAEATLSALEGEVASNVTDIATNASDIDAIELDYLTSDDLDDDLTALAAYLEVDTDEVVFTGANVYIQSGAGSTDATVNGLGNLIVGYDEDDGADDKSGSHNLVLGIAHSYSSYAGAVFGEDNSASAAYASVLGGETNTSDGEHGVVVGGSGNGITSTLWNVVVGGVNNDNDGYYSVLVGGQGNDVDQAGAAVVVGGFKNEVSSSNESTVLGGRENYVDGDRSVVTGGYGVEVLADYAVGLAGYYTLAEHDYSVVVGGNGTATSADYDVAQ